MSARAWSMALAGLASAALVATVFAAPPEKAHQPKSQPAQHRVAARAGERPNAQKWEMVTLEIRGANTPECARMLTTALNSHHVKAELKASAEKPYQFTASIEPTTDLGACGQAVMNANTPDKAKNPPSLDLVLYGKFDKESAKKATDALAKIKGVDARNSNADIPAGELNIRVSGGAKVTADQIHRDLQDAGVRTQFTRSNSARTS